MEFPIYYDQIRSKSEQLDFNMSSDPIFGNFLKVLTTSKPAAHILELGTGTGLSLSWIVAGMDDSSKIISLDNEEKFLQVARGYFENDQRISILCADGAEWISNYTGHKFDMILADT